jgi:hypothetical protein
MSTSAAKDLKAALYAACQSLYAAPVQVAFGHPGLNLEDDVVSVGRVWSSQEMATMGAGRARDEELWCDVTFSCYRGGGVEAEQIASDAAFALLASLETYCRLTDTTLGGVMRWTALADLTCEGSTDPEVLAAGRVVEIVATFHGFARL